LHSAHTELTQKLSSSALKVGIVKRWSLFHQCANIAKNSISAYIVQRLFSVLILNKS